MKTTHYLALAYAIASISEGLYWTALSMYCVDSGLSYGEVAVVTVLPGLFSVFSRVFGALGDAKGLRRHLVVTGILGSTCSLVLAALIRDAKLLVVPNISLTLAWSMVNPVLFAEAMEETSVGMGAGLMNAAGAIGWTLSVFLAGPLYSEMGFAYTALASALVLVSCAPLLFRVGRSRTCTASDPVELLRKALTVRRSELPAIACLTVFLTAYLGSSTVWSVKLYNALSRVSTLYTVVLGLAGIVAAAAAVVAGHLSERYGFRTVLILATAMFTATNSVFAVYSDSIVLSLAYLVPVWSFTTVAAYAMLGSKGSKSMSAGTVDAIVSLSSLLGPIVGTAADRLGAATALFAANAVALSVVALWLLYNRAHQITWCRT